MRREYEVMQQVLSDCCDGIILTNRNVTIVSIPVPFVDIYLKWLRVTRAFTDAQFRDSRVLRVS